ncbi:MAG: transcriptional repressor, partial [Acidobacteria bacterium]|nr:transcriptional repressor [Acidobacteriota bacterium]
MDFESQAEAGSETLQQFWSVCRERGLAMTHQRQVIYQALRDMHGHPSPEEVYERVRRQIPSISLGTVYKNIK